MVLGCGVDRGEKQIELDKRMIGDAIKRTKERLQSQEAAPNVKKERTAQLIRNFTGRLYECWKVQYCLMRLLKRVPIRSRSAAFDFDTTTRQLYLGDVKPLIPLSDTVGFYP